MARPKKQTRAKEPVRLRFKELSDGNKSIYLDIYREGKRSYFLLCRPRSIALHRSSANHKNTKTKTHV